MKIIEVFDENSVDVFSTFCKGLYSKDELMENSEVVKDLITGKHILCKYFKIHAFLLCNDDGNYVGRYALTCYPDDSTAYFGFFEVENNSEYAKYLFEHATKMASNLGCKKIVGPVDASFWIKYRLKINMFDKLPYTGEPFNKSYYYNMFLENGFSVSDHYTSNIYGVVGNDYNNEKFVKHAKEFENNDYKIIKPKISDFDSMIKDIYKLIMKLYSDFPVFKHLEEADFIDVFSEYKNIINPSMVRMAYYKDECVGFYISVPNYGNMVYNLSLGNAVKIIATKIKPKSYVMLYMGVDSAHTGLGKAIAYEIQEELKRNKLPSIGALAHDGKVTQDYGEDKIEDRYEYVLLEKNL